MSIGLYGPRVVGDEEFRRQQEVVARAAQIYGPRVTGGRAEAKTTAEPPKATASEPTNIEGAGGDEAVQAAAGADGYLSVSELRAAVTANPALVDGFLDQELARQPRPRVSALRALLEAEQNEGGARRPEIVAKIKAALGEATR